MIGLHGNGDVFISAVDVLAVIMLLVMGVDPIVIMVDPRQVISRLRRPMMRILLDRVRGRMWWWVIGVVLSVSWRSTDIG